MPIRAFPHALALLAAAAAGTASTPACARSLAAGGLGSVNWSKSQAILGAPSALEAILAQQHALPTSRAALAPASYSIPSALPAVARERPAASEAVLSGRPDIFGTVALRVAHTPLDARWRRAENAGVGGAPAQFAHSLSDRAPLERLEAVNRYVNRRVRFTDDEQQYGRADFWSPAGETLRRGRGDCEDYAIAKLQMLRHAGIADGDLYLVIVKDLVRRADHAVLVVRAAGHMLVLDNGTDEVLDSQSISDYRPVLTFAASGAWTHGYRVRSAPVNIASREGQSAAPVITLADNQRSRSASLLAFNTGFNR
jgi:predicted transglutaminase-like cysteine proteinase